MPHGFLPVHALCPIFEWDDATENTPGPPPIAISNCKQILLRVSYPYDHRSTRIAIFVFARAFPSGTRWGWLDRVFAGSSSNTPSTTPHGSLTEMHERANACPRGVQTTQLRSTPWVGLRHSLSVDDDPANTPSDHPPTVKDSASMEEKDVVEAREMNFFIPHPQMSSRREIQIKK
ncbi:hypothetical protein Fot_25670 [Forsythia ovata]|uniref:Uncharacterized protein n=1 Tax=Forsythia ovata TaxID=205694 RepID=A0ABD1U9U1_9LAMI